MPPVRNFLKGKNSEASFYKDTNFLVRRDIQGEAPFKLLASRLSVRQKYFHKLISSESQLLTFLLLTLTNVASDRNVAVTHTLALKGHECALSSWWQQVKIRCFRSIQNWNKNTFVCGRKISKQNLKLLTLSFKVGSFNE